MRRLRAAFALLFQVLLLQASVLGGGMACAPEWSTSVERTQASASASHHAHAGHETSVAATQTADRSSSSTTSDASDDSGPNHHGAQSHCAASAGCSGVVVPGPVVTGATVAVVREAATFGRVTTPRSLLRSPEPPPPRA